jgi:hypothetical protein
MFAKTKISQSMIDAVNKVIGEEPTEQKEQVLNEAGAPIKEPTPTGMRVYGSSYGNSAKAKQDQTKSSVDDLKEPTKKDIEKDSKLYQKGYHGTSKHYLRKDTQDYFAKTGRNEEVKMKEDLKGNQHKIDANHNNKIDGQDFAILRGKKKVKEDMEFAKRLLSIYEGKTPGSLETFTNNNMGEEMSDAQMKKREKIVKSMKKGMAGFKDRYGDKWKNVMYATATKQAMKEDSSDEWDGEFLEEASPVKNQDIADKAYLKHKPGTVKGTMTQLGRFLRGKPEIKEDIEHIEERDEGKPGLMFKKIAAKASKEYGSKEAGNRVAGAIRKKVLAKEDVVDESVQTQDTKTADKITTDTLAGRVIGGKLNSFKNYKVDLTTSGEEAVPKEHDIGSDTKEKQKITTNPGPVDVKLDDKLGKPSPYKYFAKEEVRGELKKIRSKEVKDTNKEISSFKSHPSATQQLSKNEEVQVDEKVIAGSPGWEPMKKDVKDKSGAVHTPMSRAKNLARQAMKKLKNETMMGKISN